MAVISAAPLYFQLESNTLAPRPIPDAALNSLFKDIKEESEGPISVATQRDHTAFTDKERLVDECESFNKHLRRHLQVNLQVDASIEEFCEHVWGLDNEMITAILSRNWIVNQPMLARYNRQPRGSPTRRRPFRVIWSKLQDDVLNHVGLACGEAEDAFCDMDEAYNLENLLAQGVPDLLRTWKSITAGAKEVDVPPRWADVKTFVVLSQVENTSIYREDTDATLSPFPVPPSGLDKHDDYLTVQNLPASLKHSCMCDCSQPASVSKERCSSQVITEDEVRLATYAAECLADYSRRYVTGILVDGTSISLYYMDCNFCIRTTPFNFDTQEGAQYLALMVFALTQCDRIHAGFDPCIQLLPVSGNPYYRGLPSNGHEAADSSVECFVFPRMTDVPPVCYVLDGIHQSSGLFGHGMSIYTVQATTFGTQAVAPEQVLKTIWRRKTSPSDANIIERLKSNVPELENFLPIVDDIGKWDAKALNFPWAKMSLPSPKNCEELALQGSLAKSHLDLWEVDTLENFKKIFRDCLMTHYLAWSKGGILHGSISEQSLGAYKQPDGSTDPYNGIVNHWDLGTRHPHRTPVDFARTNILNPSVFMAIDLGEDTTRSCFSGAPHHERFYRHDLESFFYVLVWACVHYNLTDKHRDGPHPHEKIRGWLDLGHGVECKRELFLDDALFALLLTDLVKSEWEWLSQNWLVPLRNLFADGMRSIPEKASPGHAKYDFETFNGRITFETFMEAINDHADPPRSSL